MAANTIRTGSNGFPIHRGENLLTPGYLTELELRIPPTTEGPKRTDIAHGRIWLTDERIVFISNKPPAGDDGLFPTRAVASSLTSLIIPYKTLRDIEFKVPLFSTNHLNISFGPDPTYRTNNLPDPGHEAHLVARLVLADGFGHSLYKRIEKERAAWAHRQTQDEPLRESKEGLGKTIEERRRTLGFGVKDGTPRLDKDISRRGETSSQQSTDDIAAYEPNPEYTPAANPPPPA